MNNPNDPGPNYPPHPGHYPPPPAAPHTPPPPGYPDVPGGHAGWTPPPKNGARTGLIIAIVFLALLIATGATLYFTGMFERWFGNAPATATATTPTPATGPAPVTPVAPGPGPVTIPANGQYLVGSWGPNCPGSRANSATLNSDGTAIDPSGTTGTWTIDQGSTVTVTVNGISRQAFWEIQADGAALVRPSDGRSPTLVRRCA